MKYLQLRALRNTVKYQNSVYRDVYRLVGKGR